LGAHDNPFYPEAIMRTTTPSRTLATIAFAALVGVAACDDPMQVSDADLETVPTAVSEAQMVTPFGESFRVYTRNAYLGGDTGPLFSGLDLTNLADVADRASTFWAQVQANDFAERASAIADEIAMTDPHVVGLQEIAVYNVKAFNPAVEGYYEQIGGLNMVQEVLTALAVRGLDYQVAGLQINTQGGLPLVYNPAIPGFGAAVLLEFGTGELTLVRGDVQLAAAPAQGRYGADLPLGPFSIGRGWTRVAVNFRGRIHHVVNTHLETQSFQAIQLAQTDELISSVTAGLDGVTIVMGDLNSDANAKEGDRSWTPTYGMLRKAGFADAWLHSTGHAGRGYTCCHDPDLRNATPTLDERIDFVLYRSDVPSEHGYAIPGPVHMAILGDEDGDQTASGLWPADHAAIFAGINTPRGLIQ
jgi:endonuclease/exonuclease/phosphatase family metal-dependent hydrolase